MMLAGAVLAMAMAGEPAITVLDAPARAGIPLRVQVAPATPAAVQVRLVAPDGRVAAEAQAAPARQSTLVLVPERTGETPLRLDVWCDGTTSSQTVATAGSLLRAAQAAPVSDAPQPQLWRACIAELAASAPSAAACQALATFTSWLVSWPQVPAASPMAWRDPVDGCIVPYRLHLPEGTGPFPLAIVLHPGEATIRHAWPDVPAPWLAAAQAAGVAVLGMWPAGDTRWRGVAPRRLRAILAQLDPQRIDRQRGLVLAIGQPADPPFAIHAPDQAEDPAWWRTAPGPALPPQPITDWGQRPFTVIIGTAEHRHAADGNRALAESLSQAWQRHAGVAPPLVDDGAPPPANHDLVLVGNPRSNRVLAALVTQGLHLSTTWDHRSVQAGGRTLLRATRPSIVERVTLADGRLVLVLDGGVPDWGPDLPLQGCSGLLIRRDSGRQH